MCTHMALAATNLLQQAWQFFRTQDSVPVRFIVWPNAIISFSIKKIFGGGFSTVVAIPVFVYVVRHLSADLELRQGPHAMKGTRPHWIVLRTCPEMHRT